MSHIHYKFSSKLSYATVVFDSPHITLSDLKFQIMGREKLRAGDCDLQITSAQTKEEYTDDNDLIPKGSSVIVRRIPIIGGRSGSSKTHRGEGSDGQHLRAFGASRAAMGDPNSTKALSFFSKIQMANLVDADVSEEDKIRVMINQSAYDSMNPNKKFATGLSANYTCYRCGNSGHHIRNCPLGGEKTSESHVKLKKSTGIPRSFMVEVDDPNIKGAMLTNCGRYAIPAIDAQAYAVGKKEKPPFIPQDQPQSTIQEDPIPDELLCLLCRDVLCDAVVIPCCGNSYCDDCIRTALLDSQDHVCPTCNQANVSPDSLIANKFLRQAVNSFNKEQGNTKSLGSTTVVPTPVVRTVQSQSSSLKQQENVPVHLKAVNTLQPSLLPVVYPTSASDTPRSSPQPMQSQQDPLNNDPDGKTQCDSEASSQSLLVSSSDPTETNSLSLLKSLPEETEPLQVSTSQLLSSARSLSKPSTSLHSAPSSSGCPTGGRNDSNTLQKPPSLSSLSVTPPPLFPPSVLHTFRSAHQPHNSYPTGYNSTRTTWLLPTPQGSPIPSLCSTPNSSSSIPGYSQRDWYSHPKTRKERSPPKESSSRRSSSNSHSKSSKSKSSHAYSRSSSRSGSRSRSRSQSRSRDRHSRSRPPCSYSYGYKRLRSPTPSSSSSPRGTQRSRTKSPADQRHRSKGSSSHSYTSRRSERSRREAVLGESNLYDQNPKHRGSLEFELDGERYLQWKKEYTEMCEKYFSAYVSQFHMLPLPPFLTMAPNHYYPGWDDRKRSGYYSHALDSHKQHISRRDKRSPSSESSSYSRSPSQSSSDSRSTGIRSPSGSHSSPTLVAKDRSSPMSQSSSDGHPALSEGGAQTKECGPLPFTDLEKKNASAGEKSTEKKQRSGENIKSITNKMNKCEEDQTEDDRKSENKKEKATPAVCDNDSPAQDKTAASDVSETVRTLPKIHSPKKKHPPKNVKEKRKLEEKTENRKRSETLSKQDLERRPKVRTSEESPCGSTDRKPSPVDNIVVDSGSQKKRKKEEEDDVLANKSGGNIGVDPKIQKSESSVRHRKMTTMERKRQAVTELCIWEGGITVKPQKKISISINLDLQGKGENNDQKNLSGLEEIIQKSEDPKEPAEVVAEDEFKESPKETNENDQSQLNTDIVLQENNKQQAPEREEKELDPKNFTNANFVMLGETAAEDRDRNDEHESNLWQFALSGEEEEEAVTVRDDQQEQNMEELAASSLKPRKENTFVENRGEPQKVELEEERMRWNKEDALSFSEKTKDAKMLNGEKSSEDGSKDIFGGGEAEEIPEIQASVKTKKEKSSGQITNSQNWFELMKKSSSKWETKDIKKDTNHPNTFPTMPPQLSVAKIQLETKEDINILGLRSAKLEEDQDTGSVLEKGRDKKKNSTSSFSQRAVSPSNGRNYSSSSVPKHREPSTERDRNKGREMERQKERNKYNENLKVKEREKNTEKEGECAFIASGQKRSLSNSSNSHSVSTSSDMEGRNWQHEGQRWNFNSSSCPDGNPPGLRSGGSSMTSRYTEWPDHRAHKSHQVKEKYNSLSDFQDQSKTYRHQEKPAGTQRSPPVLSHSHSKEKRSLETPRESSNQRTTLKKSLNESKQERNKWEPFIGDNPVKEGKSRRENPEEGSSQWVAVADERNGETNVSRRRELEENERTLSSKSRSSAFRENCRLDEKKERKEKKQRRI